MCKCALSCGKGSPTTTYDLDKDSVLRARGAGGRGRNTSEGWSGDERLPGSTEHGGSRENLGNVPEEGDSYDVSSDDDDPEIEGEAEDDDLPGIPTSEDILAAFGHTMDDVDLYSFGEQECD